MYVDGVHFMLRCSSPVSSNCACPGFELSHCDDPGVPQFGITISDQGHFAGSSIMFGCELGYTLHGSAVLKCMTGERRAWDNNLPSCIGNHYVYVQFSDLGFRYTPHLCVCHGPLLRVFHPMFVTYFIIQNRCTINIAQLGVNSTGFIRTGFPRNYFMLKEYTLLVLLLESINSSDVLLFITELSP